MKKKIHENLQSAGQGVDQTIPITHVQDFIRETHAYMEKNADKITKSVNDAVGGFIQGGQDNITNGVATLVKQAVESLFGSTEASDASFQKYYVALEGISLIRLDIMGWKRALKASSLTTKVEQVSAFVMSKSTVDIENTDFNTFLDLYQQVIKADNPDAKNIDIIREARELYDAFTTYSN